MRFVAVNKNGAVLPIQNGKTALVLFVGMRSGSNPCEMEPQGLSVSLSVPLY